MDCNATVDNASASDADNKPFEVRPWVMIDLYDLRNPITKGLDTLTIEEILSARDIVMAEIERRGHEQFKPRILLMDNKNKVHLAIIHVIHDEAYEYDGNNSRNCTFWVADGKIVLEIPEKKRPPAQSSGR